MGRPCFEQSLPNEALSDKLPMEFVSANESKLIKKKKAIRNKTKRKVLSLSFKCLIIHNTIKKHNLEQKFPDHFQKIDTLGYSLIPNIQSIRPNLSHLCGYRSRDWV